MQQINVILPVAGIDYVGPPAIGATGVTSCSPPGILAVSKAPEAARAMAKFMAAPEAAPAHSQGPAWEAGHTLTATQPTQTTSASPRARAHRAWRGGNRLDLPGPIGLGFAIFR